MRKYTVLICILAMVALMMPTGSTSAMGKLGPALQTMTLDPIHQDVEKIPVFITLQESCVIQQTTDSGQFAISTHELNSPTNFKRIAALSSVLRDQDVSIETLVGQIEGIEILNSYQLTTNSLRALIPRDAVTTVAELECVSSVFYEAPISPDRWVARGPLNCWPVYDGETDLDGDVCLDPEGRQVDGRGVVCSVSDTGLDYTHIDFGSQKRPEGKKVIISHDFGDSDDDCQEKDGVTAHGTCCSGIIAADGPDHEKGIAPKALLAGYKISGPSGALTGDVMATWEMMVEEDIDVSNNSWGRPFGYTPMREAENNAVLSGVSVIASQGNNGAPGPMMPIPCGSTSSPENVIAVGALKDWTETSIATISDAPDMDYIGMEFKGTWGDTHKEFNDFGRPIKVVDCGWGREGDYSGVDVSGKIALIQRGPTDSIFGPPLPFSYKLYTAHDNGALAVFLYNHSDGFLNLMFGNYAMNTSSEEQDRFLPCLEMLKSQGLRIQKMLHVGNDWELGMVDPDQNDVYVTISTPEPYGNLVGFTSMGPSQYGTLKPDVSAEGHKVRTTYPMWAEGNEDYFTRPGNGETDPPRTNIFNGTSAAGPFVCGVTCLVRQARPEWDPFEVKRSLMNTASILKRFIDDSYIPLLSQGLGRPNAFDACMTDVLIQPPSALIVHSNSIINIADQPEEIVDRAKKTRLPTEIQNSMIAYKVYNYDKDDEKKLELSYEVNSRQADDIKVTFTSDTITVPKCPEDRPSSHEWFGIDIERPNKLYGGTNDIIIWVTDKETGQKWHVAVCIYNNQPTIQGLNYTHVSYINYANLGIPPTMTPNGDGISDGMVVNYTMTNGNANMWSHDYDNFANGVDFLIKDYNGDTWQKVHNESILELGEHSFAWDGLGEDGDYLLPNGEWFMGVGIDKIDVDWSIPALVFVPSEITLFKDPFLVSDSIVPPLPTITAYALPTTPGKGNEFMLGIYIEHATNIKSIQFNAVLPGMNDIASYKGYELGDFMLRDTSRYQLGRTIEHEEGSDKIWVDIQRPHEGVSGEGWLVFLKLLPTASNYLDITFENLLVSYIDEETSDEKIKLAFYNTSFVTIADQYYEPADFNRDGKIDQDDMDIISEALGSVKGEDAFNWRCDLNRDKIVNMQDMAIFAQAME